MKDQKAIALNGVEVKPQTVATLVQNVLGYTKSGHSQCNLVLKNCKCYGFAFILSSYCS